MKIEIAAENSTALLYQSQFPYIMSRVQNKLCDLSIRPTAANKQQNSNTVCQVLSETVRWQTSFIICTKAVLQLRW